MDLAFNVARADGKKLLPAFRRDTLLQASAVGLSAQGAVPVYGILKDSRLSDRLGGTSFYGEVPGVGPE